MYITTTSFFFSITALLCKFNTHLVVIPFLGDTRLAGFLIKVTLTA